MSKGITEYKANIRAAVRALWNGTWDRSQFIVQMSEAIDKGFGQAWTAGAKECGISVDERSDAESAKLNEMIASNSAFIPGFADAIIQGSKANKGKLGTQFARANIWVNRYQEVQSTAKAMACGDKKLKWVLNPTKENCSSCSRLHGKVKRASFWDASGIIPRVPGAPYLECNGYQCGCSLNPTDEAMSRGPLPSLP